MCFACHTANHVKAINAPIRMKKKIIMSDKNIQIIEIKKKNKYFYNLQMQIKAIKKIALIIHNMAGRE